MRVLHARGRPARLRREELLTYEEIATIIRVMAGMGLRRVRITGGEPLVRRDLVRLVEMIRAIPEIEDIALDQRRPARAVAEAAARRRRSGQHLADSLIRASTASPAGRVVSPHHGRHRGGGAGGVRPIKINTVIMRGRNDDEIEAFARMTLERPWHVRFIEVMPVGENLEVAAREFVSANGMLARVRRIGRLEPVVRPAGSGPPPTSASRARQAPWASSRPMSHNYCERCNRMRLTANGELRPCLFGVLQTDLRGAAPSRRVDRDRLIRGSAGGQTRPAFPAPGQRRRLGRPARFPGRRLTPGAGHGAGLPLTRRIRVDTQPRPSYFAAPTYRMGDTHLRREAHGKKDHSSRRR